MNKPVDKVCALCGGLSEFIFNIGFKPVSICDGCAAAITKQQVVWWAELQTQVEAALKQGSNKE